MAEQATRRPKKTDDRTSPIRGLYRRLTSSPQPTGVSVGVFLSEGDIEPGSPFDLPEFKTNGSHAFGVLRHQVLIAQRMAEQVAARLPSDAVEFEKLIARLRDVEARLNAREQRNGHVNLESIERRLCKLEARIEGIDQRVRRLAEATKSLAADVGSKRTKLAAALASNGARVLAGVDAKPIGDRETRAASGRKRFRCVR